MTTGCEKYGHDPNHPPEIDVYCNITDGSVTAKVQIKVRDGYWNLFGIDREQSGMLSVRYKPRYQFIRWPPADAPSLEEYEKMPKPLSAPAAGGE